MTGFDTPSKLAKALDKAAADMRHLDAASAELGATLVGLSRGLAPARSGDLRASIAFRVAKPNAKVDTQVGGTAGSAAVRYAGPIHWGWKARNIAASLFLVDALGRMVDRDVIGTVYADAVDDILTNALT